MYAHIHQQMSKFIKIQGDQYRKSEAYALFKVAELFTFFSEG